MSIVIPYYCKEKLFAIEMETFLPKNDQNSKPRFFSVSSCPPPPLPLSFSWEGSDLLAVPMSDHSILI